MHGNKQALSAVIQVQRRFMDQSTILFHLQFLIACISKMISEYSKELTRLLGVGRVQHHSTAA